MSQDRTRSIVTTHPTPQNAPQTRVGSLTVSEYSDGLRQYFDVPLKSAREGATVTATVTVYSMGRTDSGRASGVVTGAGGSAIAVIPHDSLTRLVPVLTPNATVMIRGSVEVVAGIPTIRVRAAQAVA